MEPTRITDTKEHEYFRKLFRAGVYEMIIERIGVDQYRREWHSFHLLWVAEKDLPPESDRTADVL